MLKHCKTVILSVEKRWAECLWCHFYVEIHSTSTFKRFVYALILPGHKQSDAGTQRGHREVMAPSFVFCRRVLNYRFWHGAKGKCRPRLPGLIKNSLTSRSLEACAHSVNTWQSVQTLLSEATFTLTERRDGETFSDIWTFIYPCCRHSERGSAARLHFQNPINRNRLVVVEKVSLTQLLVTL